MPEEENPFESSDPVTAPGSAAMAAIPPEESDNAPAQTEDILTAQRQALAALEEARKPAAGGNAGEQAVLRLLAIVEDIHRATASHSGEKAVLPDVIARIERLENWVATNRLA